MDPAEEALRCPGESPRDVDTGLQGSSSVLAVAYGKRAHLGPLVWIGAVHLCH